MTSNKPVDRLADNLKGLIIGASGTIPGYQHGMLFLKSKRSHTHRERETVPRHHLMNDTPLSRRNQADGRKMWCEVCIDEYQRMYSSSDNGGKLQEKVEKELVSSFVSPSIVVN